MIIINQNLKVEDLKEKINLLWQLSGEKINRILSEYDESQGAPVFTVNGKYTTRGWTEWTHGFQFGSSVLQYDALGDSQFIDSAKKKIIDKMATHVSHTGVHDHGFNNLSRHTLKEIYIIKNYINYKNLYEDLTRALWKIRITWPREIIEKILFGEYKTNISD